MAKAENMFVVVLVADAADRWSLREVVSQFFLWSFFLKLNKAKDLGNFSWPLYERNYGKKCQL